MKYLFGLLMATVLLAGCQSSRNAGRPGDESYSQTGARTNEPNDRIQENRPSINLRQGWNN